MDLPSHASRFTLQGSNLANAKVLNHDVYGVVCVCVCVCVCVWRPNLQMPGPQMFAAYLADTAAHESSLASQARRAACLSGQQHFADGNDLSCINDTIMPTRLCDAPAKHSHSKRSALHLETKCSVNIYKDDSAHLTLPTQTWKLCTSEGCPAPQSVYDAAPLISLRVQAQLERHRRPGWQCSCTRAKFF